MNQVHFNTLDLNLLRVLSVMLEERSVTRTGARLGLTQSAVSHALGRLRELLGDPLFTREGRSMRPTTRATEIARAVQAALDQLQAAVASGFDPKTTDRTFSLIAGGYIAATLMPGVVEQLRREAPFAQLRVRGYSRDLDDRLNSGQIDIVIGNSRIVPQRFSYRQLFEESLVWTVRAGHPITREKLTVEALAALTHVAIDNPQEAGDERVDPAGLPLGRSSVWFDAGTFEGELARRGLMHKIGAIVPDGFSALAIVRRSNMAALLPRRLVMALQSGRSVAMLEPPYPNAPIGLGAHYRPDRAQDPAFAWFLDLLTKQAASL